MQIEVGKEYINWNNEIVKIVAEDIPNVVGRVFIDNIGRSYYEDGEYYYGHGEYCLVSEVIR